MSDSRLVYCSHCKFQGRPVVLGSMDEQGHYFVIIGHNRGIKIVGDHFAVVCDTCSATVFFRDMKRPTPTDLLSVKVNLYEGTVSV